MRVALISDLHFDVNHVDLATNLPQQAAYLRAQGVDLYLIAGDLTNHFRQSLAIAERLQALLAPAQVRFIAGNHGNHDMVHDVSYEQLETFPATTYLHNRFWDLPGTDWRVIGNNGWYDYEFADNLTGRNFRAWKNAFWVDSPIPQPMSDPERMDRVLTQVRQQLVAAQRAQKKVLLMTHFAPRREYIRYTHDDRFWNMANALMGSPRLGQLITNFRVPIVQFGHLHRHFWPQHFQATTYYNQTLGYHNRRINEWYHWDYLSEWRDRLRLLDLH